MQIPRFSATIIDNESDSREMVFLLLQELFPTVKVLGEASGVTEGVELLMSSEPDIVFLDVEMADGTGFDVLERLPALPGIVIFITAYDKYAIRALRSSAFDYILKPFNRNDFSRAVQRAMQKLQADQNAVLINSEAISRPLGQKIALPQLTGLRFVDPDKIFRCEANGNYTIVHFSNGQKETISRSLGQFETDLASSGFVRVHHKHLVNLNHVSAYQKGKAGGYLKMDDNSEIEVSVRRRAELLSHFSFKG